MSIRVDVTEHSTVVRCSSCPNWYWAGAGGERIKGHKVAALHEASVHPGLRQAHDAAEKYAARLRNVRGQDGDSQRGHEADGSRDRVDEAAVARRTIPPNPTVDA